MHITVNNKPCLIPNTAFCLPGSWAQVNMHYTIWFPTSSNIFNRVIYLFWMISPDLICIFFTQLIVKNYTISTLSIVSGFLFGIEMFYFIFLIILYYSKHQTLSKTKDCLLYLTILNLKIIHLYAYEKEN